MLGTHHAFGRLDQRSIHAVHLVVQSARVAQVVAGAVAPPQRRRNGAAVDALSALAELQIDGAVCECIAHRSTRLHIISNKGIIDSV